MRCDQIQLPTAPVTVHTQAQEGRSNGEFSRVLSEASTAIARCLLPGNFVSVRRAAASAAVGIALATFGGPESARGRLQAVAVAASIAQAESYDLVKVRGARGVTFRLCL